MKYETPIIVQATIRATIEKVWKFWTLPEHITKWNYASDEWCTPRAENDFREGGKFIYRMEAKDGSMGFDFSGVYNEIKIFNLIEYTMDDGRKAKIIFTNYGDEVNIAESFDAEEINSLELQRAGWQMILNNFKKYVENV